MIVILIKYTRLVNFTICMLQKSSCQNKKYYAQKE